MDFEELLDHNHSKTTTVLIVNSVIKDASLLKELMNVFLKGNSRLRQRASWPISFIAQKRPSLMLKVIPQLTIELEKENQHPAIYRNILRTFQYLDFPEEQEGRILNRSFELLNAVEQPIAVKVFAMTVIANLAEKYPDIKPELRASIESLLPNGSPGIKSRGKKLLKKIN